MFFMLSFFIENKELISSFKLEKNSVYASLFLFSLFYIPINMCLSILSNAISRRYEYEADIYAVSRSQNPQAFISALKNLSVDNLSNLRPHPLKVLLFYDHPPVLDRITAIEKKIRSLY
jgi:STE24 endopeptidase